MAGLLMVGVFFLLLAVRLNLFDGTGLADRVGLAAKGDQAPDSDTWLQIFQKGHKIGYAHRILMPAAEGYEFSDEVFMRINTMGVVQALTFSTRGTLNRDLSLAAFQVRLASNMFRFAARGSCVGRNLTLYVGEGGEEKKYDLVLNDIPYVAGNIVDAAFKAGLRPGEVRAFSVFDPASMGVRPVKVSLVGHETRTLEGGPKKLIKISVDFMGARQYAWLDEQGRVMREEGLLGMALERVSKETALQGMTTAGAGADMTELASVAANGTIQDPAALSVLRIKLGQIDEKRFYLEGGRQSYRDGLLTIQKESLAYKGGASRPAEEKAKEDGLRSTPFVQADHARIRAALREMVSPGDAPGVKMKKIVHWVYRHLEKQPVLSVSNAVETLTRGKGDCTEHAVLVAALARAAGIPATIETGLVYQRGRFYFHAWNVFLIEEWNQWITADAVFDQIPADVTHIRFIRGEAPEQLDLIGLMGRIKLEIIR